MNPSVKLILEEMGVLDGLVTTNALGWPIHKTQEGIENFWKWFDGSVVVDKEGRPLVAFHGTNTDFNEFSEKFGKRGALGAGHYFTVEADPDKKSMYGNRTMAVYLRVTNPADKPDVLAALRQTMKEFDDMVDRRDLDYDDRYSKETEARMSARTTEILQEAGFDGIMMKDDPDKDVVVFSPNQIKSAMNNRGGFSVNSNRITEHTMINESVREVMNEILMCEASREKDEGPSASDKAKVQKVLDDKSMPEKAEDDKAYVIHWADGRAVFAVKTKKAIKDWLEKTGSWACIVSIKYDKPEWKGKRLRVKS